MLGKLSAGVVGAYQIISEYEDSRHGLPSKTGKGISHFEIWWTQSNRNQQGKLDKPESPLKIAFPLSTVPPDVTLIIIRIKYYI